MDNKDQKNNTNEDAKNSGTSEEKASFDQNGAGASEKFGQAGEKPNESGEDGPGTVNKEKKP